MEKLNESTYKLSQNETLEKKGSEWRVIYPIKKDINKPFGKGNINWFNFLTGGSIKRLIQLAIILILLVFLMWSYNHDIAECREYVERTNLIYGSQFVTPDISYDENLQYNLFIPPQDTSS